MNNNVDKIVLALTRSNKYGKHMAMYLHCGLKHS
jgi:hypothetical protein